MFASSMRLRIYGLASTVPSSVFTPGLMSLSTALS
jgi:hypothetical protein